MKQYDLDIITAYKTITFKVQEPETIQEASIGLSYLDNLPEKQGMIYFSLTSEYPGYPCMNARMNTRDTKFPVDFLFVDSMGNIRKIDKNVPALSSDIHTDINTVSVIELNAGDCEKYGIEVGDSIIHEKLNILPGNKIMFRVLFDKITERTLYKIKTEDMVFFALAEGGAMGWAGTYQIITKNEDGLGFFFIHRTGISSTKVIENLFPPIKKARMGVLRDYIDDSNWSAVNMGMGNHLFIRKDVSDDFFEQASKVKDQIAGIYRNWIRIAKDILHVPSDIDYNS